MKLYRKQVSLLL